MRNKETGKYEYRKWMPRYSMEIVGVGDTKWDAKEDMYLKLAQFRKNPLVDSTHEVNGTTQRKVFFSDYFQSLPVVSRKRKRVLQKLRIRRRNRYQLPYKYKNVNYDKGKFYGKSVFEITKIYAKAIHEVTTKQIGNYISRKAKGISYFVRGNIWKWIQVFKKISTKISDLRPKTDKTSDGNNKKD